jgi:hypothetical protein
VHRLEVRDSLLLLPSGLSDELRRLDPNSHPRSVPCPPFKHAGPSKTAVHRAGQSPMASDSVDRCAGAALPSVSSVAGDWRPACSPRSTRRLTRPCALRPPSALLGHTVCSPGDGARSLGPDRRGARRPRAHSHRYRRRPTAVASGAVSVVGCQSPGPPPDQASFGRDRPRPLDPRRSKRTLGRSPRRSMPSAGRWPTHPISTRSDGPQFKVVAPRRQHSSSARLRSLSGACPAVWRYFRKMTEGMLISRDSCAGIPSDDWRPWTSRARRRHLFTPSARQPFSRRACRAPCTLESPDA